MVKRKSCVNKSTSKKGNEAMGNKDEKMGLRSIQDIKKEANNKVEKLSEEKSNTENAVENLIDKIEETFEDGQKQTEKGVSDLNTKRVDLENTVQSRMGLHRKQLKIHSNIKNTYK